MASRRVVNPGWRDEAARAILHTQRGAARTITPNDPAAQALALSERVKELTALHRAATILLEDSPLDDRLRDLVALLPPAMQFPDIASAAIRHTDRTFMTPGHRPTPWTLSVPSPDPEVALEVAYREQRPAADIGPFLEEERALLTTIARLVAACVARARTHVALEETLERMHHAFTAANMGLWELDIASNAVYWSRHLSAMLGIDGEPAGLLWGRLDVVHPDDREQLVANVERVIRGEALRTLELRMRRPDGTWRRMAAAIMLVRGPDGTPKKIIAALRDVTEQRMLEDALRQTQKVEALGQVAAGVAHDFNNILMIIMSGASFLEEAAPEGELREVASDVLVAAERGAALTHQLLAFSRKSTFTPSPVDVTCVLRRLQPLLVRVAGKNVKVLVDDREVGGEVWADPTQVEQVVLNLVVNARDAMPDGGSVTVVTRPASAADESGIERAHAAIEVRDTGTGIPDDVLPRIFEPFFTTKGPGSGTGLGLAVVTSVVRQWQGRLEVDTEPGVGTTFRVLLPIMARG